LKIFEKIGFFKLYHSEIRLRAEKLPAESQHFDFAKKHAFSNDFHSNIFNSQNRHFSDTQQQKAQYQPSEERIRR